MSSTIDYTARNNVVVELRSSEVSWPRILRSRTARQYEKSPYEIGTKILTETAILNSNAL